MLEVKIPGIRVGRAYAGEDMTKGKWVTLSGTFDQSDIDTIVAAHPEQANAAGFAKVGSAKVLLAAGETTLPAFPVNKLILQPEDAEADLDTITAGEGVIYYVGGEYETDQFTTVTGTGAAPGDFLKLDANSKLAEEADPAVQTTASVAIMATKTEGLDSLTGAVLDRVWFRMIPK